MEFESVSGVRHDLEYDMDLCDAIEGVPDEPMSFGPRHAEAVAAGSDAPDTSSVGLELWGCHRHSKCRSVCRCHLTSGVSGERREATRVRCTPRLGPERESVKLGDGAESEGTGGGRDRTAPCSGRRRSP